MIACITTNSKSLAFLKSLSKVQIWMKGLSCPMTAGISSSTPQLLHLERRANPLIDVDLWAPFVLVLCLCHSRHLLRIKTNVPNRVDELCRTVLLKPAMHAFPQELFHWLTSFAPCTAFLFTFFSFLTLQTIGLTLDWCNSLLAQGCRIEMSAVCKCSW